MTALSSPVLTVPEKLDNLDQSSLETLLQRIEVAKRILEVDSLRASTWWDRMIGRYVPIVTAILAVSGFWFGVWQYYSQKSDVEAQRSEDLRREAAKPFWDTQLRLYVKASEAAATIATSDDEATRSSAEAQFWILYWGPLSCVEDVGLEEKSKADVEAAMVKFGKYLNTQPKGDRKPDELKTLSLALAHAMRDEIAPSFSLQKTPLQGEQDK